jgi:hypothetical protein
MTSLEELRKLLRYDPETGEFTWLVNRGRGRVGQPAGSTTGDGYRQIEVAGRSVRLHRVAWFWMTGEWPPEEIDHINSIKADNRWCNLRLATRSQNRANTRVHSRNQLGLKGVSYQKKGGRWSAQICVDNHRRRLGSFDSPELAHAAYMAAARKAFGEFANDGKR